MKFRNSEISDGLLHERLAILAVICLIMLSGPIAFANIPLAMGICMGALCAYFIDPDLDLRGATRAENRMYQLNKPIGALFQMYYVPYSLIPHGSIWSHGGKNRLTGWIAMVLVATPIRIIYSHLWILLFVFLPTNVFREFLLWIPKLYWVGLYTSWAIVDVVHWFRDRWLN